MGWPLLVVLIVLFAGLVPWAFPSPYQRRAPAVVGLFAYFAGTVPLLGALLAGPEPGLGRAAFLGGFVALWMTAFFGATTWWVQRRGWLTPRRPMGGDIDPAP